MAQTVLPAAGTPLGTSPSTTTSPAGTPVVVTNAVAFESSGLNALGQLDVYAPGDAHDLPVVVMLHGPGVDRDYLAPHATRVAQLGTVVFAASWGRSGGAEYDSLTTKQQLDLDVAQAACGIAFAAENATQYGGDAASLTVFGHSGGGNIGSIAVFGRAPVSNGCLVTNPAQVDAFVAWEGDWLAVTGWDEVLAEDPSVMQSLTPWSYLPGPDGLRFIALRGEDSPAGRSAGDALGDDGWLALRDPDGRLLKALQANHAFADGFVGADDGDQVLIDTLAKAGREAESRVLPGSSHGDLSNAGWEVFLDTFRDAAGV